MRKFNIPVYAAVAAVAAVFGCTKENAFEQTPSSESYHVTFTAQKSEDDALTKAVISSEDSKVINWSDGDAISVFDGDGKNCKFTLKEGAGKQTATFEGEVTSLADSYTVLYPYQADAKIESGTLTGVSLGSVQTAVSGSFAPEAGLMAARSEGDAIKFQNVVGYVKFVCGFDCRRVTVRSNDYASELAGNATISFDATGNPLVSSVAGARSEVRLEGNIEKGRPYYIALLPGVMDKGFSLTFTSTDWKQYERTSKSSLEIKRGVVTNLGTTEVENTELQTPYITFSADAAQTFTFVKGNNVTIDVDKFEYSVNGGEWTTMTVGKPIAFGGADGDLRLRGKSPDGTSTGNNLSDSYYVQFSNADVGVRSRGDIRTLIDWENYSTADTKNARFGRLFYEATALVSAPDLPITKLASSCYTTMFYETSIERAPELPAVEVPEGGYYQMFKLCNKLKSSPDLKATKVGSSAYYCMFQACMSLKKAPEIYATEFTGSNNCYCMFIRCSAMEEGPSVLRPETLRDECYSFMFQDCSSLKKAPVIKGVKINGGERHCYLMFDSCTSLEEVQEQLFAEETVLYPSVCQMMFYGCTSLKKAPALPSMNLSTNCYYQMFNGCTSLVAVPESLPATKLAQGCYYQMFCGCSSLIAAPKLPAETLASGCYKYMFDGCTSLKEAWIYAKNDMSNADYYMYSIFASCPQNDVTVHIYNTDGLSYYKRILGHDDWTYLDIETGEKL